MKVLLIAHRNTQALAALAAKVLVATEYQSEPIVPGRPNYDGPPPKAETKIRRYYHVDHHRPRDLYKHR